MKLRSCKNIYHGNDEVYRVYQGDTLIWGNNTIIYTSENNEAIVPWTTEGFGATYIDNQYDEIGEIVFDDDITTIPVDSLSSKPFVKVHLPKNVTEIMESAFEDDTSLTNINLDNVTNIGEAAFSDCISLTDINVENVEYLGDYSLFYCHRLMDVVMKKAKHIGRGCFEWCRRLRTLEVLDASELDRFGFPYDMFSNCYNIKSIKLNGMVQDICLYRDYPKGDYSRECLLDLINSLGIPSTTKTIEMNKVNFHLLDEDIALLTSKNWKLNLS